MAKTKNTINVPLSATQLWFLQCAINLQNAVLPLEESVLDSTSFERDYGISKQKVQQELNNLEATLNKILK